jgi:hypothetical protein
MYKSKNKDLRIAKRGREEVLTKKKYKHLGMTKSKAK